ncbi:MAG: hypothetical protein K0R14_223 [Burkholderiales bacterium]|jgi:hypothetical protein|nr:hypothetical protein [Burkholderiales bacterium]
MAKASKGSGGSIFPMPPKKTGHETEINKTVNEDKQEDVAAVHKQSDERITNVPHFTENLFEVGKATDKAQSVAGAVASYDEVETEEIIVKIVDELSKSEKVIGVLSNMLAQRLMEQLNTNEIITFISKSVEEGVSPEFINFKEHLLKYTVMLQEQIGISIKQITSDLFLKGKNL